MSHGTNPELALRDLAIEIEVLQADRDRWRKLAQYLCANVSIEIPSHIAQLFPEPMPYED